MGHHVPTRRPEHIVWVVLPAGACEAEFLHTEAARRTVWFLHLDASSHNPCGKPICAVLFGQQNLPKKSRWPFLQKGCTPPKEHVPFLLEMLFLTGESQERCSGDQMCFTSLCPCVSGRRRKTTRRRCSNSKGATTGTRSRPKSRRPVDAGTAIGRTGCSI